jgi:CheY-like chemotaxis protein
MTRWKDGCHLAFTQGRGRSLMRVLIVEDEARLASLIRRGLAHERLAADICGTGKEALWMAEAHDYDAIVLDVMLPGESGFEICSRLRAGGVRAPVLMLTARDAVEDRIAGLDSAPTTTSSSRSRSPSCSRAAVRASGRRCWRSASCGSIRRAAKSAGQARHGRAPEPVFRGRAAARRYRCRRCVRAGGRPAAGVCVRRGARRPARFFRPPATTARGGRRVPRPCSRT